MASMNVQSTPAAFAPEEGVTTVAVKPALRLVREKIVTTIRAVAMNQLTKLGSATQPLNPQRVRYFSSFTAPTQ